LSRTTPSAESAKGAEETGVDGVDGVFGVESKCASTRIPCMSHGGGVGEAKVKPLKATASSFMMIEIISVETESFLDGKSNDNEMKIKSIDETGRIASKMLGWCCWLAKERGQLYLYLYILKLMNRKDWDRMIRAERRTNPKDPFRPSNLCLHDEYTETSSKGVRRLFLSDSGV
jgi:hypothetical protein